MRESAETRADAIIDVVLDLIESEGLEAVQVRTVASRARVSLATMYKLFGTLDELVISAVWRWMDTTTYTRLTEPEPGETPYDYLVRIVRALFEPWDRHPRMLEAYYRACSAPGGERLVAHGRAVVLPMAEGVLAGADPSYLDDLKLIFENVAHGSIARFAEGAIAVSDILPILERTLFRLMSVSPHEPVRPRGEAVGAAGRPHTDDHSA